MDDKEWQQIQKILEAMLNPMYISIKNIESRLDKLPCDKNKDAIDRNTRYINGFGIKEAAEAEFDKRMQKYQESIKADKWNFRNLWVRIFVAILTLIGLLNAIGFINNILAK